MGFGKFLFKTGLYIGIFLLGYTVHGCISQDNRYIVRKYTDYPYLVDKKFGDRIPVMQVNGKMQTGNLEYRINGILKDDRLEEYLNFLKKNQGLK